MLGGRQRPTRFQRLVARHPLGLALVSGLPLAATFATFSGGSTADAVIGACFGSAFGLVYGLTALSERYRQHRLIELGLWDGSLAENAPGRWRSGRPLSSAGTGPHRPAREAPALGSSGTSFSVAVTQARDQRGSPSEASASAHAVSRNSPAAGTIRV